MGNRSGKVEGDGGAVVRPQQEKLEHLFTKLCHDEMLDLSKFEQHFQGATDTVTKNLFNQFFIDLVNTSSQAKFLFVDRCCHVLDRTDISHTDHLHFLFDLTSNNNAEVTCEELKQIVHVYFAFGVQQATLLEEDVKEREEGGGEGCCVKIRYDDQDQVIASIAATLMAGRVSIRRDEVINWIQFNCPLMSAGLHSWLHYKLTGIVSQTKFEMLPQPIECEDTTLLLTPSCLWYLNCILPSCYTYMENKFKTDTEDDSPVDEDVKFTWNLLYNSNQHGLSLNRFKHKVMEYKSPTITIFELSCGMILVLALDQKWSDSPEKYGGPYCQLIELSPVVSIIEANSKMVYLKELGRSLPTGLWMGSDNKPKVKISTDLNSAQVLYKNKLDEQVERMEVWGCGGVEAMKSQEDVKKWEKRETEKRKKVKLPGQWDQDKSILEMGGVNVNHSQRGDT